jgi:protein ImuB
MLACLYIPLFPLAARLRSEPDVKGEAVAVFEGNGNAARVIAATRKAREKGLQPGMTLPHARSLLPRLLARARDPESERAAQEALLEIADTFSPRVEDAGEGLVYLDLEGLPQLREIGSPQSTVDSPPSCHPEKRSDEGSAPATITTHNSQLTTHNFSQSPAHVLARTIISAAEKASLPLKVGIAASKLAARVAAGLPDSPTVVPEGEERRFLAPLPLSRLAPAIEIAEMLERWGIRSIGEFARLPEGEVASRLGELGREFHAAARGIDPRPLEPRLPPVSLSEGMDLEWPLVSLEPFLFLGNAALERLVQRLESQGLACVKLETTLKLDPDGCDARSIALPAPTREVKTLLTLMRLELEARPPGAPVSGFTFTAHPDRPRRAQLSLFGPAALSPDRLATTIARLAALLGAGRVGSPRTVDGHRPERFTEVSFAPAPPPTIARPPRTGRGLLAVRVLRPPIELEVITESRESRVESPGSALPPFPPICHPEERRDEGSAPVIPINNHKSSIANPPNGIPLPDSYFFPEPGASPDVTPIVGLQSSIANSSLRLLSIKTVASDAQPQIAGAVKIAAGPWSLEESWWLGDSSSGRSARSLPEGRSLALRERERGEGSGARSSPHPGEPRAGAAADPEQAGATFRDYWDVELSDGALYRIYRDRTSGAWFADGIYD